MTTSVLPLLSGFAEHNRAALPAKRRMVAVSRLISRAKKNRSGDRGGGEQAGGFVVTEHEIQVLNRLAGRALAEIVDRGEHAQSLRTAVEHEREVAEVCRAHVLQFRHLASLEDAHETRLGETRLERGAHVLLGSSRARTHENLRQEAARYAQEVRTEPYRNLASEREA